jgi:hypothetical protein
VRWPTATKCWPSWSTRSTPGPTINARRAPGGLSCRVSPPRRARRPYRLHRIAVGWRRWLSRVSSSRPIRFWTLVLCPLFSGGCRGLAPLRAIETPYWSRGHTRAAPDFSFSRYNDADP